MLKLLSILEKVNSEDENVFASSIIEKYENRLDDQHSLCLTSN